MMARLIVVLIAFLGLQSPLQAGPDTPRNVVISTDLAMGLDCTNVFGSEPKPADPDDAWALAWALEESGWNVIAVVVSFGNCSCDALDVGCTGLTETVVPSDGACEILDRAVEVTEWVVAQSSRDVPVLRGSPGRFAADLPSPAGTAAAVDIIRDSKEPVTVIGIGPATDPAFILRDLAESDDLDQVDELYLEMGQFGVWAGQVGFQIGDTRVADYNFRADPGSVQWLLDSKSALENVPALTLVPYNAIRQGLVTEFMLDSMARSKRPAAVAIAADSRAWSVQWGESFGEPGFHLWDVVCCLAAADGAVFLKQSVTAVIDCIEDKPALTLAEARGETGITCAYHLARTEPPLSTATLEFGDPPAPLAIPFQNAIAEIGMLGCMALDGDGRSPCPGDLNNDGVVDGMDLGILISVWGACP